MDVESLEKCGRRRESCLHVFLVMSVALLFVAVTAVAAGGAMIAKDLESRVNLTCPGDKPEKLESRGLTATAEDKMRNFAYLRAASSELKNSTMSWNEIYQGASKSIGGNFVFDKHQHSLKPEKEGVYFMFIDLNFTCTYQCKPGLLSVSVGNKLTCRVDLPKVADSTPVSKKCWTVTHMEQKKLFTQMTVPENGLQNWKLELDSSGFGMFLVG